MTSKNQTDHKQHENIKLTNLKKKYVQKKSEVTALEEMLKLKQKELKGIELKIETQLLQTTDKNSKIFNTLEIQINTINSTKCQGTLQEKIHSQKLKSKISEPSTNDKIKQNIAQPISKMYSDYCGICDSYAHGIEDCNKKGYSKTLLADNKCLICYNDKHITEDCQKLNKKGPCILCYHHTIRKCRKVKNYIWFQNAYKMIWE